MDFDFEKKRIQFVVFIISVIVLSFTAEKCRHLVGEEASSQSGKFTFLNCFDMGSGSVACGVKEGVKLYFYNIRSAHVERARHGAIETALIDAVSQGMPAKDAAKQAQKEGDKAAKLAKRQAKRIIGPIISSGWDFFEALYYGGTVTEGFLRASGTLFGAYSGGFVGEQRLGRFGYLVGSHLGSWVGGRIGLMVYDVVNGVHYLINFGQGEEESEVVHEKAAGQGEEESEVVHEKAALVENENENEALDDSPVNEAAPNYSSSEEDSRESYNYESPSYENFELR